MSIFDERNFEISLPKGFTPPDSGEVCETKQPDENGVEVMMTLEILSKPVLIEGETQDKYVFKGRFKRKVNIHYNLVEISSDAILLTTSDPLELDARIKAEIEIDKTKIDDLAINIVESE